MEQKDITLLKEWFSSYTGSFATSHEEDRKNISLKIQHTYEVCKNIIRIAQEETSNQENILLAEAIALLHDVGRFQQYAQYRTFDDRISENHGALGSSIIQEGQIIQNLSLREQDIITYAVKFHNALSIPKSGDPAKDFSLKLIRDADKLDIWRVFVDYYESSASERSPVVAIGLPDTPEYSDEALSLLMNKQVVTLKQVKTLNDYKLVQLSWIYDLHFPSSYTLLHQRNYINRIISHLPQTQPFRTLLPFLEEFVSSRISS